MALKVQQSTTAEDVLSQLHKWIVTPPENSRVFTFTPEISKAVLDRYNKHNRPFKRQRINEYAAAMREGRFKLTGDTIKFSDAELLRDGQNRLKASLESGCSFVSHVVFGIEDDVFVYMDRGKNRNPSDVFKIAGVSDSASTQAIVKRIMQVTSGTVVARRTYEPHELLTFYEEKLNRGTLEVAVDYAKRTRKVKPELPVGDLGAVFYLVWDHPRGRHFAEIMASGVTKGEATPIKNMMDALYKIKKDTFGRVHDTVRFGMLIKAWNVFAEGKRGSVSSIQYNVHAPFPEMIGVSS